MSFEMTRKILTIVITSFIFWVSFVHASPDNVTIDQATFDKESDNELIPRIRPCNLLLSPLENHLKTPQIIERYGYPLETHKVITEDGYILQTFRIPAPGKPVVLLMHGVMSSCREFVVNCEKRALAFKLADEGYDVWLANRRGNSYSNHISISKKDPKFWNFSQDEMVQHDVPSTIDYILNQTGRSNLSYVGMSMGNAVMMLTLAIRPEYNEKINVWFAMAASVDLKRTKSYLIQGLSYIRRPMTRALKRWNRGLFIPMVIMPLLHRFIPPFCRSRSQLKNRNAICSNLWFFVDGYDPAQIPPEVWSILVGEFPEQNSVKSMTQWMQWIRSGDMTLYDYGPWTNLKVYGTLWAKRYPIQQISTSVVFFEAQNDYITTQGSANHTKSVVKNSNPNIDFTIIPVNSPTWNHIDFVAGKDADILVYTHIIRKLRQIYQNE